MIKARIAVEETYAKGLEKVANQVSNDWFIVHDLGYPIVVRALGPSLVAHGRYSEDFKHELNSNNAQF